MREDIIFLVVDDDDVDRTFIRRAFRTGGIDNRIEEARDGEQALAQLARLALCRPTPPVIVLLDINLPRRDGFEFLEEVRRSANLKGTVVFVLTSSAEPGDVAKAYEHNVAGYIVKGRDGIDANLTEMIRAYCEVVQLPDRP